MVRLRRVGVALFATAFIVVVGAAMILEGIGLAAIAAIGFMVVAAMTIPFIAMFEEEHDLPEERARRAGVYPHAR